MKGKLAINGGNKTVDIGRPHYKWPVITDETRNAVLKQLDESISIYDKSGIIDTLEKRFAEYYGKSHALLTNSGTAAIHSMYVGAELKEGDEVICPAYTFFATVTPLFHTGAVPVLCGMRMDGNIDPAKIEEMINERTKAIVVVHMWGIPCEMDRISEIARDHELMLFEDCSHSHGAIFKGKKLGTFGDASSWSLNVQKQVSAGEGGVMITDNDEIYYRTLLFGHYNKRCRQEIPKEHPFYKYSVTGMGLKLRIHTLAAAIANQQFDYLEAGLERKRKFARRMIDELSDIPGIDPPRVPEDVEPTWYAFVMQYKPDELGELPIQRFYDALQAEGCEELDRPGSTCPLNYHPLFQNPGPLFPNYSGKIGYRKGDFPIAEKFHENSLKLPVWDDPKDEKLVNLYIEAFRKVAENYREIM